MNVCISPLTNCCFHQSRISIFCWKVNCFHLLETELSLDLILWHFIHTVAPGRKEIALGWKGQNSDK